MIMNKQETIRLKLGLRSAGFSEKAIDDFIIFLKTGDERYKPEPDEKTENRTDE